MKATLYPNIDVKAPVALKDIDGNSVINISLHT